MTQGTPENPADGERTGSVNFTIGSVTGTGSYLGNSGTVVNINSGASSGSAPQLTPAEATQLLLQLMAELGTRVAAQTSALPAAPELTGRIEQARKELSDGRRRPAALKRVQGLMSAVLAGASGIAAVTETVDRIVQLIRLLETDI